MAEAAVLEQTISPEQRAAMRAAVTALLDKEQQKAELLEQLPVAIHRLGDKPIPKVGDLSSGEFVRTALEFCGNDQLKSGRKTLAPYWRETAIEAGLTSASAQQVDDRVLAVLQAMNKGTMATGRAVKLAIDDKHDLTLRAVDGVIEGYESVMEAVSPDRKVPVRPINEILKSEFKTVKTVDGMISGTSNATVLDGYLAGIELGKLDIYREHPEFVKPATNDNEATINAKMLKKLEEVDNGLESVKKNINILHGKGYIKDSELKSINAKEKELETAKETGDVDKITKSVDALSQEHQAVLKLARPRAQGAGR